MQRQDSEGYWRAEQDYLADVVRQMARRQDDPGSEVYPFAHLVAGDSTASMAYPNVFITVAPAEWRFPLHEALFNAWKFPQGHETSSDLSYIQSLLTLHLHNVLTSFMQSLVKSKELFHQVFEYALRIEFQSRGTLHIHMALWAARYEHQDLRGNCAEGRTSPLVDRLASYGFQTIDVQYGSGYLNYINGYTAKASDAMDFRLDQHTAGEASSHWRTCYRLVCKRAVCVPEIIAGLSGCPLMLRSFTVEFIAAPCPRVGMLLDGSESLRAYAAYLRHWCGAGETPLKTLDVSFLEWCRRYTVRVREVITRQQQRTCATGVRFAFELQDRFIGQYAAMFSHIIPSTASTRSAQKSCSTLLTLLAL